MEFTPLCGPDVAAGLATPRDLLGVPRYGRGDSWRQWLAESGVEMPTCRRGRPWS